MDHLSPPSLDHSVFPGAIPNTDRSNLKILSLDGGGMRGLSMLVILEAIFYLLNSKREEVNLDPIEPYQYFDLIGGTSTGGIIALMLGRLRMTIQQCKDEYVKMGKKVFGEMKGFLHENKFDAGKLEDALKQVVSEKLTSQGGVPGRKDAPLMDPRREDCCKTIVFTVSYVNASPVEAVGLRTYRSAHFKARNFTIWQAARATSAAPTFFERLVVPADGKSHWVDGGLNVNNPADKILDEVKRLWGVPDQRFDLNRIGLFLTLGTGIPANVSLEGGLLSEIKNRLGVPEKLIRAIVKTTFNTEGPHQHLLGSFNETPQTKKIYHRFNVNSSLRDIEFFEYDKQEHIREYTDNYLRGNERVQMLNDCVKQAMDSTLDRNHVRKSRSISAYPLAAWIDLLKTRSGLLDKSPEEDYFDHLTVAGMEIYEAIYTHLPKDPDGYVNFNTFSSTISSFGPTLEELEDIWKRMRGGLNARMSRNLTLNILYMIHVECFDSRFSEKRPTPSEDGKWPTTDARFIIAKSFGNWVKCRYHKNDAWCGRSWSYANHQWGMCRGLDTDVECVLWQWYQTRVASYYDGAHKDGFYRVTMHPRDHANGKLYRGECRKKWLEYSEGFK